MICYAYKPSRKKRGKSVKGRLYRGRYQLPGDAEMTDIPLNITDKQLANQEMRRIYLEKEREGAGLIAPKLQRDAALRDLSAHLDEYIADLIALGRSEVHIRLVKGRVRRLITNCGWENLRDVSADSFQIWRAAQGENKSPKTLNEFLSAACAFFKWLIRQERAVFNPFEGVTKVETRGRETLKRRALTEDELGRLLAVAGPRKVIYMAAYYTGLRRAELGALQRADLDLEANQPIVKVRASTTKNRRKANIELHRALVKELKQILPAAGSPADLVFADGIPSMIIVRNDLKAAGIDYVNSLGHRADFHSLRKTCATHHAKNGTPPQVTSCLLRHSDIRLTMDVYTDTAGLPTSAAVQNLRDFSDPVGSDGNDSHIDSHDLFLAGPRVSRPVTDEARGKPDKTPADIGDCHALSLPVTDGRRMRNGGERGIRTLGRITPSQV